MKRAGWRLVRELGVEYASPAPAGDDLALECPVALQREGGFHLIVDERATENSVPATIECRTLLLDDARKVVLDSKLQGIHDGYGCLVGDETIALMRRSRWDVLLLSFAGEVTGRIDLAHVSKRMPRTIACTAGGTLLVTFLTKSHNLDVAEVDLAGSLLWYAAGCRESVGVPGSVQRLEDDTILYADEFRHVVGRLRRDGTTEPVRNAFIALLPMGNPELQQSSDDQGNFVFSDIPTGRYILLVAAQDTKLSDRGIIEAVARTTDQPMKLVSTVVEYEIVSE